MPLSHIAVGDAVTAANYNTLIDQSNQAYPTLTALQAVTGSYFMQRAVVTSDPTVANNTSYVWTGSKWLVEHVYATINLTSGTAIAANTVIAFNSVLEDPAAAWDATNHRWAAPISGRYAALLIIRQGTSAAAFGGAIRKNTAIQGYTPTAAAQTGSGTSLSLQMTLAQGDLIDAYATVGYTPEIDPAAISTSNTLQISRIG